MRAAVGGKDVHILAVAVVGRQQGGAAQTHCSPAAAASARVVVINPL